MKRKSLGISLLVTGMMLASTSPIQAKTVKRKLTIKKGTSVVLKLSGTKRSGTLKVSKKKIVKVKKLKKNKWKVTGIKVGTAKLTIKAKKKKYVYTIKVKKPNKAQYKDGTTLYCFNSSKENDIGIQDRNVNVTNYFYMYSSTYSDSDINYSSSNPQVATLDQYGNLTPTGAGTTKITAKVGGLSASCKVTVHDITISTPSLPLTRTYSTGYDEDNDFTITSITFTKNYYANSHKFYVRADLTGTLTHPDELALIDYKVLDQNNTTITSGSMYPDTVNGVTTASAAISGNDDLSADTTYHLELFNHQS